MKFKPIEETLVEQYPHIDIEGHIWQELISTAVEYGSGWNDLIIELLQKVEEVYEQNNVDVTEFKIRQIKEKYARLRVYARSSITEVCDLVIEYENKSKEICDECGGLGSLYKSKEGWLQTLCKDCASKLGCKKVD